MKASFVAREVLEGIRGNFSMIFSIVLVTFVSLSFVAVAGLLQVQIGNLKSYWYDKAQIAVYLCNDFESDLICPNGGITETEQFAIAGQLESSALTPYIGTYYFETQDEAYQRLIEESGELTAAQYLNPDQLNAAYWLSLADPAKADLVVEALESQPGVAVVADRKSVV